MAEGASPHALKPRLLLPGDGSACARLMIRTTPIAQDLYTGLGALLDELIAEERIIGGVIEAIEQRSKNRRIAAATLSAFVPHQFMEDYLAHSWPCLTNGLLTRCVRGERSILLDRLAQAEGNLGQGLDMVMLDYVQDPMDWQSPEGRRLMTMFFPFFLSVHRGFNLRTLIIEMSLAWEEMARGAGYMPLVQFPVDHALPPDIDPRWSKTPRAVFGLTRDMARQVPPSTPIAAVFTYHPPRFRFTPVEQRILTRAAEGLTDDEIAGLHAVSHDAVKQTWRSVYDHVLTAMPELLARDSDADAGSRRGQEKRRRIVAYVRDNAQELKPHFMRRG